MEPFLAPLNHCNSIVCGPSQFGPVRVDKCIIDSGCTSLLLPWPDDPDETLAPLLADPRLKSGTSLAGSVGSDHATFHVQAPSAIFEVTLACHRLFAFVSELRFVVTHSARQWLRNKSMFFWTFDEKHVHDCNLDYALVGQTVLSQLLCLNVFDKGILFLCSLQDPSSELLDAKPLSQWMRLATEMYREETSSPQYERLRDLRTSLPPCNPVNPVNPVNSIDSIDQTGKRPRLDLHESPAVHVRLGARMDHFGIGKLTF